MSESGNPWLQHGPTPVGDGDGGESPMELLLRAALNARANEIGVHRLRPAAPPGGGGRRVRYLYTLGLPLVGVAAAGMAAYLGLNGATDLADHRSGPAVTAGPTTPPSAASSRSAATGGTGAKAVPGSYLPATWLAPSNLPRNSFFHWKASDNGALGGGSPADIPNGFGMLYTCGIGSSDAELSAVHVSYLFYAAGTHNTFPVPHQASQTMFYFPDAATASTAMATIRSDYEGCAARQTQKREIGFGFGKRITWTVTRTVSSASGFAYRTQLRSPDGRPDSALQGGFTDDQELFARSGNVVTMVGVRANRTDVDPAGDAPQVLAAMADRLAAFPH